MSVVENFRSTVKHRLGVDYEAVSGSTGASSMAAFGLRQDGPYEGRPGSTRSPRAWAG